MEKSTIPTLDPIATVGRGTFGKVILARARHSSSRAHLTKENLVAVKVIPKSSLRSSRRVQKTETELKVLTEIAPSSSFLVSCNLAFQTDDLLVYIMDYSLGGDLRNHLKRVGRFPEATAVVIGMQIVLGLEHLHSHGILYRDLKPDNLLISSNGQIQLADFGLSKFLPKIGTKSAFHRMMFPQTKQCLWGTTKTACGTPIYQAPEMIRNRAHGLEADWWAFGNVLFELLTGRPPFFADTVKKVYQLVLNNNPKYPSYLSPNTILLISGLLVSGRQKRLGYGKDGVSNIKDHPFFMNLENEVTWKRLEELKRSRSDSALESDSFISSNPNHQHVFIREYVIPNKAPLSVAGFIQVPNDTFSNLVSTDVASQLSSQSGTTLSDDSCVLAVQ
jgi:serine/threonine protein kinase